MTVLRFAGIIIVFAGVALFGVFFIGANARATDSRIPASSWKSAETDDTYHRARCDNAAGGFVISLLTPNGL
jgi:hypothetical protein